MQTREKVIPVKKINLGGAWQMRRVGTEEWQPAQVPGSVYADLMRNGSMPDPFWRDNELEAFELLKEDYEYSRTFEVPAEFVTHEHILLRCEGLDTLARIYFNGLYLGKADNMHVTWEYDVKDIVHKGHNMLRVVFASPIRYAAEADQRSTAWESSDATPGFRHMRKVHCMFGWDWGPRLPDAGIWREISLVAWNGARVTGALIMQAHRRNHVILRVEPEIEGEVEGWRFQLTWPNGRRQIARRKGKEPVEITLEDPMLWWPRGYGAQPLYKAEVIIDGDRWTRRIGLRSLTVSREKDQWGEEFCHIVNGVKIFAMGADYIPEDNIFQRITPQRTRRLLEDAALANMNTVRVWGGGYYPSDEFYDICDELGILVWQDLMYACAFYDLTPDFERSIRRETEDNVRRLRHHASLALICGNNEMEMFMGYANDALTQGRPDFGPKQRFHVTDYVKMFESILPGIVKRLSPQTFWWPASPSSGGCFDNPNDPSRGDVHYWDVWHGEKPFTEYRKFIFRYASEFGFQSFPCLKTVESFTEPQDRNVFSRIMERHQRNASANGKIMAYMAKTFRYPSSFDNLLYASQLLQAEAIRYGVEHWRRHRGACMGAIIWQLNDCWPVASWSSIDYFGRWKALHYAAKRFFAPLLISAEEEGELTQLKDVNEYRTEPVKCSVRLNLSNETRRPVEGIVSWALRRPDGSLVRSGVQKVKVPALSAMWLEKMDFVDASTTGHYVSYSFRVQGKLMGEGTVLFCAPKHFEFMDPRLSAVAEGEEIIVTSKAYARQVWVESEDPDLLLSDNAFDMNPGEKRLKILRGRAESLRVRSVWDVG